jgi:hypothetical protein
MKQPVRVEAPPLGSPVARTLLVMAITSVAEAAMLGAVFFAHAQQSVPGLVLAVGWPWVAAFIVNRQLTQLKRRTKDETRPAVPARRRLEVRTL